MQEQQIPRFTIDGNRKPTIVNYTIKKKLQKYIEFRQSLFERVYPIKFKVANKLIDFGYKHLSRFGRWCPVKVRIPFLFLIFFSFAFKNDVFLNFLIKKNLIFLYEIYLKKFFKKKLSEKLKNKINLLIFLQSQLFMNTNIFNNIMSSFFVGVVV